MKTKPFDMKAALAGAKVVTRNMHYVAEVKLSNCPIYVTIRDPKDFSVVTRLTMTAQGRPFNEWMPRELDLVMVDEDEEGGDQ